MSGSNISKLMQQTKETKLLEEGASALDRILICLAAEASIWIFLQVAGGYPSGGLLVDASHIQQ